MVTIYFTEENGFENWYEDDRYNDVKCPKCGIIGMWYEHKNVDYPIKCGHCGQRLPDE